MKRVWPTASKVLVGLFVAAVSAMPQGYTISARPGVVNYVEGNAFVNGQPISEKALRATFLNANDTLSTDIGKAEVLLTPGVFLRVGENSQIRIISASLTNTQVEVSKGEAMIEAAGLVKENNIQVIDHGGSITIQRNGLYRFTGDNPPTMAVLDGKADVAYGEKKVELGKGRQVIIAEGLREEKFDTKKEDELYAWSNVRSEYEAAATYKTATAASFDNSYGGWYGYGFDGGYGMGPGWYWANGFNSWAWLPGNGAFFSPFGYGFYGPGAVAYAPVIVAPVYRTGNWRNGHWTGRSTSATVPVNPNNPPAAGVASASPFQNHVARTQVAQSFAASGFRTGTGTPAASFSGGHGYSGAATHAGGWSGGSAHASGEAAHTSGGGGFSAGAAHSAGGFSGGSGGGGHAGGGGGGHK